MNDVNLRFGEAGLNLDVRKERRQAQSGKRGCEEKAGLSVAAVVGDKGNCEDETRLGERGKVWGSFTSGG